MELQFKVQVIVDQKAPEMNYKTKIMGRLKIESQVHFISLKSHVLGYIL